MRFGWTAIKKMSRVQIDRFMLRIKGSIERFIIRR
jgi:hypothetical protein